MKQETIDRIRKFVSDREWEQYHTPANLAKSISIEANELLECFQWSDTDFDLEHVKEELADVITVCGSLRTGTADTVLEDEKHMGLRCRAWTLRFSCFILRRSIRISRNEPYYICCS